MRCLDNFGTFEDHRFFLLFVDRQVERSLGGSDQVLVAGRVAALLEMYWLGAGFGAIRPPAKRSPSTLPLKKGVGPWDRSDAAISHDYQREHSRLLSGECTIFGSALFCFHGLRFSMGLSSILSGERFCEVDQGESQLVISLLNRSIDKLPETLFVLPRLVV
jgi:hypothetical protein